jgi:hypothetical protein
MKIKSDNFVFVDMKSSSKFFHSIIAENKNDCEMQEEEEQCKI